MKISKIILFKITEALRTVNYLDISRVDFPSTFCIHISGGSLDADTIKRVIEIPSFRCIHAHEKDVLSIIFNKEGK